MLVGDRIVHLTKTVQKGTAAASVTDTAHFHYDGQGKPAMVVWNGTRFGYLYNAQGDVLGLITGGHSEAVKYTYDAWGKLLKISGARKGDLALINPFRYRGYIYDAETEMYYLQTRYYKPEWGRFISADKLFMRRKTLHVNNLYVYCHNSPTIYLDDSGSEEVYIYNCEHEESELIFSGIRVTGLPENSVFHYYTAKGEDVYIWTDFEGKVPHSRHYSDHGNPKNHPYIPHDHDWHDKNDGSGNRSQGNPLPPDDSYSEEGAQELPDLTKIVTPRSMPKPNINDLIVALLLYGVTVITGVPVYQLAPL